MKEIVITLEESCIDRTGDLAKDYSKQGLLVKSVYPIGVITGTADDQTIELLRTHKEVAQLKEAITVRVPNKNSKIQ